MLYSKAKNKEIYYMDISSIKDENLFEYTAKVQSTFISGDAKIALDDDSLAITVQFDVADISYADILELQMADYSIVLRTESGNLVFSQMGRWCEPFFEALYAAYNKKVLKSMFVSGSSAFESEGEYRYAKNGMQTSSVVPIKVYSNSVCVLSPDIYARRIPLCFMNGIDEQDYVITLRLLGNESYTLAKMGSETKPFIKAMEEQIRAIRETTIFSIKEIDPTLSTLQSSKIAGIMSEGVAAKMGLLKEIAPSFAVALEGKIASGRAADTYKTFCELCDPAQIYVGFKKNISSSSGMKGGAVGGMLENIGGLVGGIDLSGIANGLNLPDALGGVFGGQAGEGEENKTLGDQYMLWMIAPSPDGKSCAVEFAGDTSSSAATFIYRFEGDFDSFAYKLNRALEAISFKREVIRLTEEELLKAENIEYRMAIKRNTALSFVRSAFKGRIIHSSAESWQRKLLEFWNSGTDALSE